MADDDVYNVIDELLMETNEDHNSSKQAGSRPGHSLNIERKREQGAFQLYADYFAPNAIYTDTHFWRRIRVSRSIFDLLFNALVQHGVYFAKRVDCTELFGIGCTQKCTAALRIPAYGGAPDQVDEYIRMGESRAL